MAKQRKSAAKIAHQRRKTKKKQKVRKKKEPVNSLFPSRRIIGLAVLLFVFGYGGTWVFGLTKSTTEEKEITASVLTAPQPTLFDKVIDRLFDNDLPHLQEKKKKALKALVKENKVKVKIPSQKIKPEKKRAELPVLKLSEEKKIVNKSFSKDHLSKNDKEKLDQLLSKYGF
jgi:hypothetical protein